MFWWILTAVFAVTFFIGLWPGLYSKSQEKKYHNMSCEHYGKPEWKRALKWSCLYEDPVYNFLMIALMVMFLIVLISQIITLVEYSIFTTEFEILREQYNTLDSLNSELLNIYNISDLNKKLAEWQAHYLRYGYWWTVVTEDVMNILPIGA